MLSSHVTGTSSQPPLSSIAERRTQSGGEESEEDDDEEDGAWRAGEGSRRDNGAFEEAVIKTGYLWKKGERRKVRAFLSVPMTLSGKPANAVTSFNREIDVEEAMVRLTPCASCVLQDR